MVSGTDIKDLPSAPNFRKILGPSFILLGLGLGSGEVILWPYLVANFGLGIIWGAIVGITFQFFINMEIERYALVRGESVFVGFAKKLNFLPVWFIVSTFIGFGWPGIIGASAKLIGSVLGIVETHYIAIFFLILIGIILTLGPVLYKTVEKFTFYLILIGVPFIFVLTFIMADTNALQGLFRGILGFGEGYRFLPGNIPLATFLGAFAFSGAGGNLNLAQSFYVKEKGYGMGKYSGRITSVLTGKKEDIKLTGNHFAITTENLKKFSKWWRLINKEHLIVFWLTGVVTICSLAVLSFSTAYGKEGVVNGVNFVIQEALTISSRTMPAIGILFLIVGGLMLFQTQLTVMDATSRIMGENLLILKQKVWSTKLLPRIYYSFLWAQIIAGITIFSLGLTEPLLLLIISSVINAFAMFVHIGLTLWLNLTSLEKTIRPSLARIAVLIFAFVFFGFFSFKVIQNVLG